MTGPDEPEWRTFLLIQSGGKAQDVGARDSLAAAFSLENLEEWFRNTPPAQRPTCLQGV